MRLRHRPVPLLVALALVVGVVGDASGQQPPSQVSATWLVMPHPDDETGVLSRVLARPDDHEVVVMMTHGEQSSACRTAAEGAGPAWYQGPGSPVGQPDLGEVNPLGTGTNVWTGRWSPECRRARVASTLAFLEDRADADPTAPGGWPGADAPAVERDLPGTTRSGVPPQRDDGGEVVESRRVRVWHASRGRGSLVFLDLGDGDLTAEEVAWGLRAVADAAPTLGIPDGDVGEALGAFRSDVDVGACHAYDHPDHRAVHVALATWDLVDAPQLGRTCEEDPEADPSLTARIPDDEYVRLTETDGDRRVGAVPRIYGWLAEDDWSAAFLPGAMWAQQQWFWRGPRVPGQTR